MLYFAWIPSWTTPFDPVAHARQDLDVLSLEITEEEGAAPGFTIEVANPGIGGIIGVGSRYAVISEQAAGDAVPVLLARGKVAAAPSELTGPVITLEFTGVQPDAINSLRAYADTLRTNDAFYDDLFVSQTETFQPETALNGRPVSFYWDRKTLVISTSSIVTGSRTVDLGGQALEGLQIRLTEPPVRHAKMRVSVSWDQRAAGTTDIKGQIARALGNGITFGTYTWQDVTGWWPTVGSSIGDSNGWTITKSKLTQVGQYISPEIDGGSYHAADDGATNPTRIKLRALTFRVDALSASYQYSQPRQESIELLAEIGIQDVLGDDRIETLSDIDLQDPTIDPTLNNWRQRTAYAVGNIVSYNGRAWRCEIAHTSETFFAIYALIEVPGGGSSLQAQWKQINSNSALGDPRRAAYFATDRGRRSVEHAIEILRCFLLKRARCLELTFDVPWAAGRDLTVDDSVRVEWSQIPGGEATGKVTRISLRADGRGNRLASITAGISVGTGNPSDPPEYATSDYFDASEQYSTGDYDVPSSTSDRVSATGVVYGWPTIQPQIRTEPFSLGNASYAVVSATGYNTAGAQLTAAWYTGAGGGDPVAAIQPTALQVRMRDLTPIDNAAISFLVTCKPMLCSKGIELGAVT